VNPIYDFTGRFALFVTGASSGMASLPSAPQSSSTSARPPSETSGAIDVVGVALPVDDGYTAP
jgi:hypothetical protein